MRVKVKLFGTFREYMPHEAVDGVLALDVPDSSCVKDLLTYLNVPIDEDSAIIMVNGFHVEADYPLQENDTLSAFPAVAGG